MVCRRPFYSNLWKINRGQTLGEAVTATGEVAGPTTLQPTTLFEGYVGQLRVDCCPEQ